MKELEKQFYFNKKTGSVQPFSGNAYEDFIPLLTFIEDYCSSINVSTKMVNETLIVYHKDFKKFHPSRFPENAYIDFVSYQETNFDMEGELYFNQDLKISSFRDIKKAIDTFVNGEIPSSCYYTQEEFELKEAKAILSRFNNKKAQELRTLFLKKLKELRISEVEFLELLDLHQAYNKPF
jgi:hypothetical protein